MVTYIQAHQMLPSERGISRGLGKLLLWSASANRIPFLIFYNVSTDKVIDQIHGGEICLGVTDDDEAYVLRTDHLTVKEFNDVCHMSGH